MMLLFIIKDINPNVRLNSSTTMLLLLRPFPASSARRAAAGLRPAQSRRAGVRADAHLADASYHTVQRGCAWCTMEGAVGIWTHYKSKLHSHWLRQLQLHLHHAESCIYTRASHWPGTLLPRSVRVKSWHAHVAVFGAGFVETAPSFQTAPPGAYIQMPPKQHQSSIKARAW